MTRQDSLDRMDRRILQLVQDEFPLIPRVWEAVGTRLGIPAKEVLRRVKRLQDTGFIRSIAPVLESTRITNRVSTLVGVRVPAGHLREAAAIISSYPGVSHNYERRDEFNLWFTLSAPDMAALTAIIREIQEKTGLGADEFLDLPIRRKFKIDVRYSLDNLREEPIMDEIDRAIVMQVQDGIPLVDHPFMDVADRIGIPEEDLIQRIERLRNEGVIRRFGARINNRRCGFLANAMIAWKVPEERVDEVGRLFAGNPVVTHCYERKIIPGIWEQNVFTMVHCQSEADVNHLVEDLAACAGVPDYQVLMSGEEFKRTVSVRITRETQKIRGETR